MILGIEKQTFDFNISLKIVYAFLVLCNYGTVSQYFSTTHVIFFNFSPFEMVLTGVLLIKVWLTVEHAE